MIVKPNSIVKPLYSIKKYGDGSFGHVFVVIRQKGHFWENNMLIAEHLYIMI